MTLTSAQAQDFQLAHIDERFIANPYPYFKALRDHAPLCCQADGSIVLSRYDDVKFALSDSAIFSSDKRLDFKPKFGDSPLYEHHTTSVVFNDPPYHTRVRKLLAPFFAARVLRQMEQRISTMVDELLDRAAVSGRLEVATEFANVIPLTVIGDLLGVPPLERQPLLPWAKTILGALEPVQTSAQLARGNQAVEEFKTYLRDLIARKQADAASSDQVDVLMALVRASEQGEGLEELEILHNAIFMLNAGHDTTGALIANGIDLLLRFPEQRQRLIEQPNLIKPAVEEMLRMESPLQIGNRRCLSDVELHGRTIKAGTFLHLIIGAADHDERQFPQAELFDVSRAPNKHLAFAHGIHTCAGNSVARIEAQIAFSRMLARFPHFLRLSPTVRARRARFRAIERLDIALQPTG